MLRTSLASVLRLLAGGVGMLLAGCAGMTGPANPELQPFLGVYRGSFESALTEDPADDLNHNPCQPTEEQRCEVHHQPLADVLLHLHRPDGGPVTLDFYQTAADLDAGDPLDLLGRGCGTEVGPLAAVESMETATGSHPVAVFPLTARNRLCLGKLRPVSRHELRVELYAGAGGNAELARVVIDRNVRDENYLYVVEDGVRRRVRIDLDNTVHSGDMDRYRVCIEDDLGEYERCVLTDRRFRSFTLPVPLPGGAAVSYTWWQELRPRLQQTRGRYVVERYVGRFERVTDDGS